MPRHGRPKPFEFVPKEITDFCATLLAEEGLSENSVNAYRADLAEMNAFIEGLGKTIRNMNAADCGQWLAHLTSLSIAASSQARKLAALRRLCKYMISANIRDDNPAMLLDNPKRARILPKTLEENDISALMAAIQSLPPQRRLRFSVLFELAYGSGLRVSELVALQRDSILPMPYGKDGEPRWALRVKGKGGKVRLVPVSRMAQELLLEYLPIVAKSRYLFPSHSSKGHLTRQRIGQLIHDIAIAAHLDTRQLSPHVLRHAFATHLLAGGANLRVVQSLLGHASIATTTIYTHLLQDDLAEMVYTHHPLGQNPES